MSISALKQEIRENVPSLTKEEITSLIRAAKSKAEELMQSKSKHDCFYPLYYHISANAVWETLPMTMRSFLARRIAETLTGYKYTPI